MKRLKQILALLGVILLAGMYICTLVFVLIGSPLADILFKVSILCTLAVPVLLYGYSLIYKVLKSRNR